MTGESRPARRLSDNVSAPRIADGAAFIVHRLGSSRWYAELANDELMRLVRGVTSVDRAVASAHKAAERKRAA